MNFLDRFDQNTLSHNLQNLAVPGSVREFAELQLNHCSCIITVKGTEKFDCGKKQK